MKLSDSVVHSVRTAVAAVASLLAARLFRLPETYWAVVTTMVITVLEDFIQYAQSHTDVTFMRKVDIANYAITSPRTVREDI